MSKRKLFDCRRYIKPGDIVEFDSAWWCNQVSGTGGHNMIRCRGTAVRAYPEFVLVKLRHVTECVNRWDIHSVNGKHVVNGCFKGCEAIHE